MIAQLAVETRGHGTIARSRVLRRPARRRVCNFLSGLSGVHEICANCPVDGKRSTAALWGTERVVSYRTDDVVDQGHEVTLVASGDSITAANLVPRCTQALRLDTAVSDVVPYYMLMLDKVRSPCVGWTTY
jgi:hypothetical protein